MKQNVTFAITVYGKVQGVGFRPLVCRLAKSFHLKGYVRNAGTHVEITATGCKEDINSFCDSLRAAELPVHVDKLISEEVPHQQFERFVSVRSTESNEVKVISADIGICDNCLQELQEKGNRREGYSYISCAQCGPRYTIIRKLPYDRENTTMDPFPLCDECAEEYNDMQNRRGHGETISCYHCGPQLKCFIKSDDAKPFDFKKTISSAHDSKNTFLLSENNETVDSFYLQDKNIIDIARRLLSEGKLIMVKAVGGFNLVCRADRSDVVTRLRDLKKRMSKPFAVMVRTAEEAESFSFVSAEEKALLASAARPIVLLQKKYQDVMSIAESVSDFSKPQRQNQMQQELSHNNTGSFLLAENVTDVSDQVGVFLPSMGFYACLETAFPIIVTSCNYTGQPIIYKDEEAQYFFAEHKNIAALFTYDREILRPADDAVVRIVKKDFADSKAEERKIAEERNNETLLNHTIVRTNNYRRQIFRRTKGYMPEAAAHCGIKGSILAVGAQMEPGFCLTAEGSFFPAEIPGDITLEKTEQFFADSVEDWMQLLNIKPEAVVADLHPGYASTQWGKRFAEINGLPFYQVQHHHAHALAVMAEHNLKGKVLAVCFDGTGLGTDGTVWGGEFLLCEGSDFVRVGHLKPIPMLGGDLSMQQAWKTALCHLAAAGFAYGKGNETVVRQTKDLRFPIIRKALQQNINVIRTSSMGRLFDAAASLLGLANFNSHQGRCAMALESAARVALREKIQPLPLTFAIEEALLDKDRNSRDHSVKEFINIKENSKTKNNNLIKVVYDPAPVWKALLQVKKDSQEIFAASLGFHYAVVNVVIDMAERTNVKQVALAGGCFANRILLETCKKELQERDFQVYYNKAVSCGDGGISLGQAYYGYIV